MVHALAEPTREGTTTRTEVAPRLFETAVRDAYGGRLLHLILFGSRARGDAGPDSDVDVAVVPDRIDDRATERHRLSDIGYEVIAETCVEVQVEVQGWAFTAEEWERPELNPNQNLVRNIRRKGIARRPCDDH